MKILKLPIDTIIKCECGCEFEVEYEDFIIASNLLSRWQRNG